MEPFHIRICLAFKEQIFIALQQVERLFDSRDPSLPDRIHPVAKASAPGVA